MYVRYTYVHSSVIREIRQYFDIAFYFFLSGADEDVRRRVADVITLVSPRLPRFTVFKSPFPFVFPFNYKLFS